MIWKYRDLAPNPREMGMKATVIWQFEPARVQAPKRVAFSGFTVNLFTVNLRRGANDAPASP